MRPAPRPKRPNSRRRYFACASPSGVVKLLHISSSKEQQWKLISVRQLKLTPGRVWDELGEEEVVVTSNGRPVALLTRVDQDSLGRELEVRRRARALVALDEIQRASLQHGADRLTDEEIDEEIRAVRRRRAH